MIMVRVMLLFEATRSVAGRSNSAAEAAHLSIMRVQLIPKSGRKDSVIYSNTRHGCVARQFVRPHDPRTADQLSNRSGFGAIAGRWRNLTPEQREAWRSAVRDRTILTRAGRRVRPNCYHYFVSVNTQRADLGLPQFDLPPEEPVFGPNPVAELVVTNQAGTITLKLRVPTSPTQYTLVQGAAPARSGVRSVHRFTFLGLLPSPVNGWSDITGLYNARYGPPKAGMAVWIRTRQHIGGWADAPQVTHARVPAPDP
jgi:hypothetical protein